MLEKRTHTFLADLIDHESFGTNGFFTEEPRTCSAKARDYTVVFAISRLKFIQIS